jgi:hypothetical protein
MGLHGSGATALLLVAGCAVPPPLAPHTFPAELIGGEIQLLPMPTRLIRAAIDGAGMGHIVAIGEDNQLRYVTVTPEGRWPPRCRARLGPTNPNTARATD